MWLLFGFVLFVLMINVGNISSNDLPDKLDWRSNGGNFVTSPKDEEECASCWAFAAAGMTESYHAIKNNETNPTLDLSEQTLVSCSHDGSCTHGGNMAKALDFIRDTGLPDETCFPYEGEQENCNRCEDWKSKVTKIPGWSWVTESTKDNDAVKRALMKGPVTAWFKPGIDFEEYTGGIYKCKSDDSENHFVLLIGWNNSKGCWIAKNNWGTDWGESGFFKIDYDTCVIGKWVARVGGKDAEDDEDETGCGCGS